MCSSVFIVPEPLAVLQAASEVETLKAQVMTLFKELQQAQSKLDDAEGMKKNLQDRFDVAPDLPDPSGRFELIQELIYLFILFVSWRGADVGRWSRTYRP